VLSKRRNELNLEVSSRKIFSILLLVVLILLFANIAAIISKFYLYNVHSIQGLIHYFDFNDEKNIPTLYSSFLLLIASIILSAIAFILNGLRQSYIPWVGLAMIFLFLAVDETAGIHELLTKPTRELVNASGLLYYAWVIPYGIALVFLILLYLRFLISLPGKILALFIVSGGTFVAGAVGFELLGGWYVEAHGSHNLFYNVLYTFEELLEMLGTTIFIYALLLYLPTRFNYFSVTIGE